MSVDQILQLGDDQLANSFQLVFPTGIPGAKDSNAIALRMDQAFDPPEESVGEYEIKYMGMTIKKTTRNEATAKEFAIEVRLDQGWQVYDDLRNLYEMTYNPINGTALGDSMTRFPVAVQALDASQSVVKTITFKNSKIKTLKINQFGNEEEGPIRIAVSFIYGTMVIE